MISPANYRGQRAITTYNYDPVVQTHIRSVVDAHGRLLLIALFPPYA